MQTSPGSRRVSRAGHFKTLQLIDQSKDGPLPPHSPASRFGSVSSPLAFSGSSSSSLRSRSMLSSSSSSSLLFRGVHVILFSFFSRRRALANQVDTCVRVIFVMMASMIFSPLVGYGFFRCSLSQAFSVAVASRVAFFL